MAIELVNAICLVSGMMIGFGLGVLAFKRRLPKNYKDVRKHLAKEHVWW